MRNGVEQNISVLDKPSEIARQVDLNVAEFDESIRKNRRRPPEVIREAWRREEWKVGNASIDAIGVEHVPETMLDFRQEIDGAVAGADIVVTEFAPEAQGFYSEQFAEKNSSVKSKYNPAYSVEDLRQAYLQAEHQPGFNIGLFHHQLENIAAKYGKDMVCADLDMTKDPEQMFQDDFLMTGLAQIQDSNRTIEKGAMLYGSALALGAGAMAVAMRSKKRNNKISRRAFVAAGSMAVPGGDLALFGHKIIDKKPRVKPPEDLRDDPVQSDTIDLKVRNAFLADALAGLSRKHKKIAFIYGTNHLSDVRKYLDDTRGRRELLNRYKDAIKKRNSDPFRIFRHIEGVNDSEALTPSRQHKWKRIV